MKDQSKTKSQLIEELCELRHRVKVLSDQRQAEKDLRASDKLYRALVEHIDAAFWISTPGVSREVYVSKGYKKIWGSSSQELLTAPRAFVDSIHPDDKEGFLSTLEKYHARSKPYEQEYRIIRPGKGVIWINERGYPIRDKRGGPKLMVGICTDVTKQKETESQLHRSERRLSRVQKIGHIGDWEWDVISGEVYWSEEVFRIFKLPRQKPSFQLARSVVHPEDLDQWENTVQDAAKRAKPIRMDYRVLRPDGSIRWVHNKSEVVKDAAGKTVRFVGTVQDVTVRKQAESSLALFKSIAETSEMSIAISDPDGRLVYINPAHRRLFGRSLKEARNLNYRAFYPPESVAVLDKVVAPALAKGTEWEGVLDALDAKGRRFPLWERASTVRDAKGKIAYAFGFMQDDSKRQAAAEALAASEARYRSLVETSSAAVVSVDGDGRLTFANRRACEMVDVPEGELLGRPFVGFLHPDDVEEILGMFERRFRDPRVEQNVEFRIVRKDGEIVECLSAPTVVWDGEAVTEFNAIVQDITELKRAQEALRKSEREYRDLFNNSEVGMFRTRLDGSEVLNANEKFLSILGRKRVEVIGRPSLIHWADPRDREEMIRRLKKHGRVADFECKILHKSGEVRNCITSLSLNREEGILDGSILDITERKKAELQLQKSEAMLRAVLNNAPVTIFVIDKQGIFTMSEGKGLEKVFLKPGENVGTSALDLYDTMPYVESTGARITGRDIFRRALSGEFVVATNELRGVWFENHIGPLRDSKGEIIGMVGVATDVTERVRAHDQLRTLSQRIATAQEEERQRIARELHDQMGQSLTALSINLTTARNSQVKASSAAQGLDRCLRLVEDMGRHAENLMSELHPPILDDYGLVSALKWQAERFQDLTGLNTRVLCSREPERLGHEVELGLFRVIQEGLNNIAKHAGASSVRIQVRRSAKGLILSVSDNGRGFEPGNAAHHDERHHWGLAIMTERVRAIGGTLRVESTPGKGTRLTVELTMPHPAGGAT